MNDRSASSSDIEIAQLLSRTLSGAPGGGARATPPPQYTSFTASRLSPALRRPALSEPESDLPAQSPRSFAAWQELLLWAVGEGYVTGGFVMDPEGFVIAAGGIVDAEQSQGMGVALMMAFREADQPDHPGAPAGSIAIEYSPFTLTGIRVSTGDSAPFTLGFLAAEYLPHSVRELVRRVSEFNLPHM